MGIGRLAGIEGSKSRHQELLVILRQLSAGLLIRARQDVLQEKVRVQRRTLRRQAGATQGVNDPLEEHCPVVALALVHELVQSEAVVRHDVGNDDAEADVTLIDRLEDALESGGTCRCSRIMYSSPMTHR
jgi:hypothetical protein